MSDTYSSKIFHQNFLINIREYYNNILLKKTYSDAIQKNSPIIDDKNIRLYLKQNILRKRLSIDSKSKKYTILFYDFSKNYELLGFMKKEYYLKIFRIPFLLEDKRILLKRSKVTYLAWNPITEFKNCVIKFLSVENNRNIRLWALNGQLVSQLSDNSSASRILFSTFQKTYNNIIGINLNKSIYSWNLIDRRLVLKICHNNRNVQDFSLNKSGNLISLVFSSKKIEIWDLNRGILFSSIFSSSINIRFVTLLRYDTVIMADSIGNLIESNTQKNNIKYKRAHLKPITSMHNIKDDLFSTSSQDGRIKVKINKKLWLKNNSLSLKYQLRTNKSIHFHRVGLYDQNLFIVYNNNQSVYNEIFETY
uniref:Nucleolar rRNA processing protein n=1 Tax=Amorphochlora amoebiformis TaxID=1561963 RepID=A0A0H5BR21_9EUKA|nr:nucleolar rRNA processing protein [Amorphochlora amoebiformis]